MGDSTIPPQDKMVDHTLHCTNTSHLIDIIEFTTVPKGVNPLNLAHLYTNNGLTVNQIADRVGLSKAAVIGRLKEAAVTCGQNGRSEENYRFAHNPPYGKKVVDGKLITNRVEMKVVREVIRCRDQEKLSWHKTTTHLNNLGYRNRADRPWTKTSIVQIYQRWAGKA